MSILTAILTWSLDQLKGLIKLLIELFIKFLNDISTLLLEFLNGITPDINIPSIPNEIFECLNAANYFLPISEVFELVVYSLGLYITYCSFRAAVAGLFYVWQQIKPI